jgi:hypothetical protein
MYSYLQFLVGHLFHLQDIFTLIHALLVEWVLEVLAGQSAWI